MPLRGRWTAWAVAAATALHSAHASVYPPYDGAANNLLHPTWGQSGEAFATWSGRRFGDGVSTVPAGLPNARNVSNAVFSGRPFSYNPEGVSSLTAAWGQFIAHDVVMTFPHTPAETLNVALPACELHDVLCSGSAVLPVSRNAYDTGAAGARVPLNGATGYLDASTVYGQDGSRLADIRSFVGGKLKADPVNGVPLNTASAFMAGAGHVEVRELRLGGDPRVNENPGLLAVHGLWVLEHNRQCDELAGANPSWNDATLFAEARKRVIALIQHITVTQYVPLLTGGPLDTYVGYNPGVNAAPDVAFAAAAYRYGHSGINSQFWCFEEDGGQCRIAPLILRDVYMRADYLEHISISHLLRGMVRQPENGIDTAMVDDVRNHLLGLRLDLAAIDIMRCRDLGCVSYSQARVAVGLAPPTSWADITPDVRGQLALAAAYDAVGDVDLWVGGLAEPHVAGGFVGPTFAAIIRTQFSNTRDGDRFWYENRAAQPGNGGAPYLSDEELATVRATSLRDVIVRNTDFESCPSEPLRVPAQAVFFTPLPSPSPAVAPSPSPAAAGAAVRTVTIAPGIRLRFTPIAAGDVDVAFTLLLEHSTAWVGVGVGASMFGADVFTVSLSGGVAAVTDRWASTYALPAVDASQDVTLVSTEVAGGVTAVTVKRALSTGDAADVALPDVGGSGRVDMIFAWSTSSATVAYHGGNSLQLAVSLHAAA